MGTNRNAKMPSTNRPHPRSTGAGATSGAATGFATGPGSVILALQSPDVRNKRQVAGALDCRRQLPLMPRAHAAQPARQNLSVVGDEATEGAVVFVVDEPDPRLAERTS